MKLLFDCSQVHRMFQTLYIVHYTRSPSIKSEISVCVSLRERKDDMKLYAGFFKVNGAGCSFTGLVQISTKESLLFKLSEEA